MADDEKAKPHAGQGAGVLAELRLERATSRRWAEAYTALGLSVLPLVEGRKTPATPHGVKDATLDATSRSWLGCNVGIAPGPAGLLVVDVDPRNGGVATLAELERTLGELPQTVAAATGGGGLHLIFVAPPGPLVGKLGAGVDIISEGRYVVVEPSYVQPAPDAPEADRSSDHPGPGHYRWRPGLAPGEVPFAELPEAWRSRVQRAAPAPSQPRTAPRLASPGADVAERARRVDRARRYIAPVPPAVAGNGGHDATFQVAQKLVRGFDLDDGEAWPIFVEYNQRCVPPWSERELAHKLRSARLHGTMVVGSLLNAPPTGTGWERSWNDAGRPEPPAGWSDAEAEPLPVDVVPPDPPAEDDRPHEDFAPEPDATRHADDDSSQKGRWFMAGLEWLNAPPPGNPWTVEGIVPRGLPALLVGAPKAGKTTVALDLAISIALGDAALGGRCANGLGRPAGVGLITLEDTRPQLVATMRQLLAGRGITDEAALAERLYCWNEQDGLRLPRDFEALADELRRRRIEALIVDPLAAVVEGDENSTRDATAFVAAWTAACRRSGAAVVIVAHEGKPQGNGPQRDTVNSARGSSAFAGAARNIVRFRRRGDLITIATSGNLGPAGCFKVRDVRDAGVIRFEPVGVDDDERDDPAGDTAARGTSARDTQVLALHGQGLTVRDIAREAGTPRSTVGRILRKSGAR